MIKKNILITGSEGLIGKSLVSHFKKLKFNVIKIDIKKKLKGIIFHAILPMKRKSKIV